VEASLDGGKSYILLGRVAKPATAAAPDKKAIMPGVLLRGSSEGMAFAVAGGFALKILPISAGLTRARSASVSSSLAGEIVTSVSSERGVFGKLAPPAGSRVMLQALSHLPGPFPDGYSVSAADSFVILADLPLPQIVGPTIQSDADRAVLFEHSLRALFESIAADYRNSAIQRAVADKRKVVSGTLRVRPNLPENEPDPITAITYAIDDGDNVVCARTTAPYLFDWDTSSVKDGEHVIEVRGLSANGNVITRVRYLVVINNHEPATALHQ
jgi:hypothetical protein